MAVNCEKVVNDLFAAWARLNLDEVMGYFADDAVWDNVPMAPAKGAAAIREMTQGFMKDASAFSAKILKSVKKADVPVAGMFELNDAGKIKVWRDYFDLGTFTKQLG